MHTSLINFSQVSYFNSLFFILILNNHILTLELNMFCVELQTFLKLHILYKSAHQKLWIYVHFCDILHVERFMTAGINFSDSRSLLMTLFKTWRLPQNRKCMTYCTAVREGLIYGHINMYRQFGEIWTWEWTKYNNTQTEIQTVKQTDICTDTLNAILCTPIAD